MRTLFVAASAVLCLCPLSSLATITPIASSLILHAEANAGSGLVTDDQSQSQSSALNPLSASVSADAANGGLNAVAESDAMASWNSSSSGQFDLHTHFTTDDLSTELDSRVATGSPGWFYTFSSDQPAVLTLNYDVSHSGFDPYANLVYLKVLANNMLVAEPGFGVPSTGALTFAIQPGVDYTLQIFDNSNINQYLPALTSDMNATFGFDIVPVPEPSLLALTGAGLLAWAGRNLWRK